MPTGRGHGDAAGRRGRATRTANGGTRRQRRGPPKVQWGFGARKPPPLHCAAASVRLVPITSVSVQNAGMVGRAVTPGMVAVLPVSELVSGGSETGSALSSLLSSSASFSGYVPLPAPPASPECAQTTVQDAASEGLSCAAEAMPLALSAADGRQWLVATARERAIETPQKRSLRRYADLYADTRPRGWSRRSDTNQPSPVVAPELEEPSLSMELLQPDTVQLSTAAVLSEPLPEPESAVSPQAAGSASPSPESAVSPQAAGSASPSPESAHVGSSSRFPPRAGKLWKLVQAKHMKVRRMGSRDLEEVARSWVDAERGKAATSIQSHVRGRQERAKIVQAQERLLNTVIGLQRLHRAYKNCGPPPAMLWTATLAMLAAKEREEARPEEADKATEEQLIDDQVQEQEGHEQDVAEASVQAFEVSRITPSDRVREFLAIPPRQTSDAEVAAVVAALKAAKVTPSAWVGELQEMASQTIEDSNVLEDFFLPACVKKLQRQVEPMRAKEE